MFKAHSELIIHDFEWKIIQFPLKNNIHHSGGQRDIIESLVIRVRFDRGEGLAEVRANGQYATGEDTDKILAGLETASIVLNDGPRILKDILESCIPISTLATMLFEVAGWDALAKSEQKPLVEFLIGHESPKSVLTHSQIPFGSLIETRKLANEQAQLGVTEVKLRVGSQAVSSDLERVQICREVFGPKVEIIPDVNAGWTLEEFSNFCQGAQVYGVHWIEQPVANLQALRQLKQFETEMKVIADESARTLQDIEFLGRESLVQGVHLKLEKFGTLEKLIQAKLLTEEYGMKAFFGQMDQGMLGCAATTHIALALGFSVAEVYGYAEITEDIATGLTFQDGAVGFSPDPGLGVVVRF